MAVDVRPVMLIRRPRRDVAAFMFDPRYDLRWTGGITTSRPAQPGPLVAVRWMHNKQGLDNPARQITPREREILALLARGLSNVAIGQRLYISEATVKFHVSNVLRKLGASRRTEAVYTATKIGII